MPFKFSYVCQLLSDLEAINARNPPLIPKDRDVELRRKTQYWFRCHRRAIDLGEVEGVALLSTLLPEKRTDRVYGLQEARLCKVLARCLHLNKSNTRILQSWREPRTGGLGSCVERVLKEFDCERKPGAYVTIEEVDFVLQHLASQCRFSGPEVRSFDASSSADEQLAQLFKRLNSVEAKWLVRLVLKSIAAARIDYAQVISEYHFLLPSLLRFQNSFTSAVGILRGPLKHFPSNPDPAIQRIARVEAGEVLAPLVGTKVGRQTYLKARSLQHCVNMCGSQTWSVERKYDGEYCEVHIDLVRGDECIQIFSKSGKDSTVDRKGIHKAIRESLRLGENGCAFQKRCIVTGELVVWSDREQKILDFYHLRKHVARSGTFLGRDMDSQIKPGEHLMIIFYDILVLDDDMLLRESYTVRRNRMKEVIRYRKGYAIPAERAIIDFRRIQEAREQLCKHFAAALFNRCEGLVLKPVDAPYFRFGGDGLCDGRDYVIKLKKDYLSELDEMRDVADFAVVGASFDPKVAHKSTIRNVQFTTFHLGCCINKEAAERFGEMPRFEIVGAISLDQCIQRPELQALHNYTTFNSTPVQRRGDRLLDPQTFDLKFRQDRESKLQHVMTEPCVVEVLGSGFERPLNKNYQMLRHPRILKVHADRTWRDACTFEELRLLAEEAKATPVEGEAQEMSQLVKKLQGKFHRKAERERTATPRTATPISPQSAASARRAQQNSAATPTRSPRRSAARAKASPVLVRVDTSERLPEEPEFASSEPVCAPKDERRGQESLPTPPISSGIVATSQPSTSKRKSSQQQHVDGPSKRPRHAVQETTSPSRDNPLQPREQNMPAPKPAAGPRTAKSPPPKPITSSTRRSATTTSPARRPTSSNRLLTCTSTLCPFPHTTVFLSPCIRTFAWVRDTLLPYHGATLTPILSHWIRERPSRPTDSVVPDSLSDPEKQKVVLVETNRLEATFACVDAVKKATIGEVVLWFDWRVLEEWMEVERQHEDEEGVVGETKRKEVLERRYFGFTCWSEERAEVVFMHRDLARMPSGWLWA